VYIQPSLSSFGKAGAILAERPRLSFFFAGSSKTEEASGRNASWLLAACPNLFRLHFKPARDNLSCLPSPSDVFFTATAEHEIPFHLMSKHITGQKANL
jgi:hypothetical protein